MGRSEGAVTGQKEVAKAFNVAIGQIASSHAKGKHNFITTQLQERKPFRNNAKQRTVAQACKARCDAVTALRDIGTGRSVLATGLKIMAAGIITRTVAVDEWGREIARWHFASLQVHTAILSVAFRTLHPAPGPAWALMALPAAPGTCLEMLPMAQTARGGQPLLALPYLGTPV